LSQRRKEPHMFRLCSRKKAPTPKTLNKLYNLSCYLYSINIFVVAMSGFVPAVLAVFFYDEYETSPRVFSRYNYQIESMFSFLSCHIAAFVSCFIYILFSEVTLKPNIIWIYFY
jgi:hypothetical protein